MPAMLDDPTAPVIYRTSGEPPYPTPFAPPPPDILPHQVTLRDRSTIATLMAFSSPDQVPKRLTACLCALMNREIEKGDTYPMINQFALESFGPYWFANFGAVMFLGEIQDAEQIWAMDMEGADWNKLCLGSFYVKPNYPGRSSHVCNGGFLVTDASRNRGVGRLMGECYLEWAPRLGYSYSVFNLVYDTNVASLRIWDALGFKRIGKVKGAGNLRSNPDRLVDAIIYGRDLHVEPEEYLQEERFDKIRAYLKTNQYPTGADRAEKSRLRSASAHYRIIPATETEDEKLMLKDKEVVSDPTRQYEIAFKVHSQHHGGINKTTATIAEQYHWVRIKETVSAAIRNCSECKEAAARPARVEKSPAGPTDPDVSAIQEFNRDSTSTANLEQTSPSRQSQSSHSVPMGQLNPNIHPDPQEQQPIPIADMQSYDFSQIQMPVDPRIMDEMQRQHGGPTDHFGEHPVQHQLHQYAAAQQQHYNTQDFSHHTGAIDHSGYNYGMHHAHAGSGAEAQYGDSGVTDAQLQEQLTRGMGQQYHHHQGN